MTDLYDRPIGFSQPMMAANIAGRKGQTRRLPAGMWQRLYDHFQAGDRCVLWVKERVNRVEMGTQDDIGSYAIDDRAITESWPFKTNFITHIPRRWSRFVCLVRDVRMQRLLGISEEDAIAEGLGIITKDGKTMKYGIPDIDGLPGTDNHGWPWFEWERSPISAYRKLWNSLHKKTGQRWEDNPEVFVIEYKWHRCNIDQMEAEHG